MPRSSVRNRAGSLVVIATLGFQMLGLATPVAASESVPVPAAPIAAQNDPILPVTITLVSGNPKAGGDGAFDPDVTYSIPASDAFVGASGSARVMPQTTYPVASAYAAPITGSRWINTSGTDAADQATSRTATYSIPFVLPPGYSAASIAIDLMADNCATVSINGVQFGDLRTPTHSGCVDPYFFTNVSSFSNGTAANFHVGLNTVSVANVDGGGPNGVDFKATITYTPDTSPRPQLVANGSFESGTTPGDFIGLEAGSSGLTGWSIDTGNVDYIGTHWNAADGSRSVDCCDWCPVNRNRRTCASNQQLCNGDW